MQECRAGCQGDGKRADYNENDEGGAVTHAAPLWGGSATGRSHHRQLPKGFGR
jgi:hypothetical protein